MELLAASFDWDPSLRDPGAALAYLGRKPEEKLNYEDGAKFNMRDWEWVPMWAWKTSSCSCEDRSKTMVKSEIWKRSVG